MYNEYFKKVTKWDFDKIDEFISSHEKNKYYFSTFPSGIISLDKKLQLEIFYQKYIDKEIDYNTYIIEERKIIKMCEIFWSRNTTIANTGLVSIPLKTQFRDFKSRKLIGNLSHARILCNKNVLINELNDLKILTIIGTREYGKLCYYFQETNTILLIEGLYGIIIFLNSSQYDNSISWINSVGIYLEKI